MKDFFTCRYCGTQYGMNNAVLERDNLFCTYKCNTLWRAGVENPTKRDDAKAEDEEFARIELARKLC